MPDYDVAVIGAGPGGYVAAIRAAQLGLKAVVVEQDQVGGLCLNWGCIPSKALLHCADVLDLLRRSEDLGIRHGPIEADLGAAVDRSRAIVAKFVAGVETLLAQNGVELRRGRARLSGPGRVAVERSGEEIEAAHVIIATGGTQRSLAGVTIDGERVIGSREALMLRRAPGSIVIAGGGAVGVELAYLFQAYGSRVTIVELLPRLLPGEDEDLSRALERSFVERGIEVRTATRVTGVRPGRDGVEVGTVTGEQREELHAEKLLVGAGWTANTTDLGLEASGVERDAAGFIQTDGRCGTSAPGVWAIGDVTGRLMLAHVAMHQGVTAIETIAGREPPPIDYEQMPRAVYCRPQVAGLGLSEALARERGYELRVGRLPMRANARAAAIGETEGFVKLVADARSGAILGAHAIGYEAAELLGEAAVAQLLEATVTELGYAVHAHPTFAEALREAGLAVSGESIHFFAPAREHNRAQRART